MTQPQWGAPSPGQRPLGQQSWPGPQPSARPAFGAPSGFTQPGQPPQAPTQRRKGSPVAKLLGAMIVLAVIASIGLVVTLIANPAQAAYQNEGYRVPDPDLNPPDLPQPQTVEQAKDAIENNPYYDQDVPIPVRCDEGPIDVTTADDAELEEHLNNLMECLTRVWEPPVTAAGWEIVRPSVTVYGEKIKTKCGEIPVNAAYCGADQQVYFSNQLVRALPAVKENEWVAYIIIAHEFGHALQARTNILISAKALVQDEPEQEQLLQSRRIEVQADCLSSMFLRSVSRSLDIQQSDLEGIEDTYKAIGDDTLTGKKNVVGNHGLAQSRLYWANQGLGSSHVGTCNTYTADEKLVR
ncbi:neutral zinc metallopeptidase [Microlunatus sp. GCM10028923]|uniref:neutral zinc metallopeptidase n=1 Tax=Microlunatus sp. GCM10028923 TaxID=3273400 RepID=UPI00361EC23B